MQASMMMQSGRLVKPCHGRMRMAVPQPAFVGRPSSSAHPPRPVHVRVAEMQRNDVHQDQNMFCYQCEQTKHGIGCDKM
jgi:hypothetical protein